MKLEYLTPELNLLLLTSQEKLANSDVEFDDMLQGGSGVSANPDIDIDIPLN